MSLSTTAPLPAPAPARPLSTKLPGHGTIGSKQAAPCWCYIVRDDDRLPLVLPGHRKILQEHCTCRALGDAITLWRKRWILRLNAHLLYNVVPEQPLPNSAAARLRKCAQQSTLQRPEAHRPFCLSQGHIATNDWERNSCEQLMGIREWSRQFK